MEIATEETAPDRRIFPNGVRLSAVTLLKMELWLLVLLPNHLVVGPLGGIGSPALILGVGMCLFWLASVLTPGVGVVRTCVPLRIALGLAWCAFLVPFCLMNLVAVDGLQLQNSERFLIAFFAFTGVALVTAEGLRTFQELLSVIRTFVAGAAAMGLIGILQFRPHIDLTRYLAKFPLLTPRGDLTLLQVRGGFNRPSSTALHPIEFGVVMGFALGPALYLAIHDKARPAWRRWIPLGLISLSIPVSGGRSALLVSAITLVYFFASAPKERRRRGGLVLLSFVLFVFLAVPGMLGALKGLVLAGNSDASIAHRTGDYAYAAPLVRHHTWFGIGPGMYVPPVYRILDNQWLDSLIETGVVGLMCVSVLLATPILLGRGAYRRLKGAAHADLGQMLAASAAAAFISMATFDAFSFPTFLASVSFVTGAAGAIWGMAREFNPAFEQSRRIAISRGGVRPLRPALA